MPALEMGVDRKADLVLLQVLLVDKKKIGICQLADQIRKRKRVWTAVRKGTGLTTDEQKDLSSGANDDVTVTSVKRRGEIMTRIFNVDDQRDVQTGERRH